MPTPSRLSLAALSGLTAVLLGAFGAHGLQRFFSQGQMRVWEIAVFYQFFHTPVLLFLSGTPDRFCWAFAAFGIGILLFSGSLYLLAITGFPWLGFITPLGGVSLLVGWTLLIIGGWRR